MRRLVLVQFGIPTEDEWSALPLDFVSSRFATVEAGGKQLLLDVAEHQLIYCGAVGPDAALLDFLASLGEHGNAAHGNGDIARRAGEISRERASRPTPLFERPDTG